MVGRVGSSAKEKEKKKRKKGLVMRKLFLMLAVLLVASAAYAADATISCTADGNVVTVSYTASVQANVPRAFALDIQLSTDATITDVTPLDPNFWVYPGSYGDDPCTPVGDPCDSDDTLPGEDSNGITIEMASLHYPPEVNSPNAPEPSNALLSFKVSGDCNVYISGNAARGKVVFYDATNEDDGRDVVYTGCSYSSGCLVVGEWVGGVLITQDMRDKWDSLGQPDCWCYDCHWRSDTDGDCDVDVTDVYELLDGWPAGEWVNHPCGDTDNDGDVDVTDIYNMLDGWDEANKGCYDTSAPEYPNQGDCTPLP